MGRHARGSFRGVLWGLRVWQWAGGADRGRGGLNRSTKLRTHSRSGRFKDAAIVSFFQGMVRTVRAFVWRMWDSGRVAREWLPGRVGWEELVQAAIPNRTCPY